ncbi:Fibronectin/fibrinogen-binding protein [Lachnospiraceae bacterium TWA4]|nr:Fibronectin/fibrinogen-binding protein [Lachnospiraceae bacterium TWA4]
MALDGTVIASLVSEMNNRLIGGRLSKIAQPETDELMITIKNQKETYKLLLSANASLPLVYFTNQNKANPMTAPNFCMLLRKHIGNGKILSITQPSLERVIDIVVEHLDEMGDLKTKHLIIELMGKYSNIIFCNDEYMILDSIKHISAQTSSVREVLPGRTYFIPQTMNKLDPLTASEEEMVQILKQKPSPIQKAIYQSFTGISPLISGEICYEAGIEGDVPAKELSEMEVIHLVRMFSYLIEDIKDKKFSPLIYYKNGVPEEFSAFPLKSCSFLQSVSYDSISEILEHFYAEKSQISRIRQKSADLRRIVATHLERSVKKFDLQERQLKDTDKREKFKIYGELLTAYGYSVELGAKQLVAQNYYDENKEITIPLDPTKTAMENAKHYFEKYNKSKRTYEALTGYIVETKQEIEHLQSISTALDIAISESDLTPIKEELRDYGYIKKRGPKDKKAKITSKPFHYISSDGFHIYVGKNNYQNDELTFKVATGNDWWFHAKGMPGSHVIVKSEGKELPDRVFEEAASLAAYYSSGRKAPKVEVDYIQKKQVKKVAGAKPGFVIYHTNYSLVAKPEVNLEEV